MKVKNNVDTYHGSEGGQLSDTEKFESCHAFALSHLQSLKAERPSHAKKL